MFELRKVFKFEGGHLLNDAETKGCLQPHGHSYTVEVFLWRLDLNHQGMVEDFSVVKEAFKQVITGLDHAFLICKDSKHVKLFKDNFQNVIILDENPTAENIARFIHQKMNKRVLSDEVMIKKITLHETATGSISYYPKN